MNLIAKTLIASVFIHASMIWFITPARNDSEKNLSKKVKVSIRKIEKKSKPLEIEKPVPPKPQVKKKVKKPKKKQKAASVSKKTPKSKVNTEPVKPVLGLSKESFSKTPGGKGGMAVPAGNTTMVEDQGKRLRPEQIAALEEDLSEDASLIVDSFIKPKYTIDAEDAALEGRFVVDVFVDVDGKVKDATLRGKVGFGMDERLMESVLKARFNPRKNALGRPIAGWTEIKVRLTLE